MKKRQKQMLVVGIAIVLLVLLISLSTALADNLTSDLDFITNVQLTDTEGNEFVNAAKDSNLRLTYDYAIANDHDGLGDLVGDTVILPIPDEIILTAGPPFDLVDNRHTDDPDTHGVIATVSKSIDDPVYGTHLLVTFTKHADIYSDVSGSFWMDLQFDENEIGNDDPTIITFEVGGSSGTTTVEVDFDQPPPPETSVQKTGTYNPATNEIEWTVTVNPEEVTVTNGVLVDDIPSGLTFVADSVKVKEGAAAERDAVLGVDYTYSDPTLTYTLPTPTSDKYIVKFRTTVDTTEFIFANSHGATITKDNTIRLNHDGTYKEDTSNSVSIPIYYIEKTGSYDSADKQIDWTVTINQNGVTIPNAVLTDALPADLTLDTDSIEIDDVSIAWPNPNITYADPNLTIDIGGLLGSISEPHKIEFSTDVAASVYEENGDFEISGGFENRYNNTAILTGTNVPGNANDANDGPIGVDSTILRKTGGGTSGADKYDRENSLITWIVTVNTNQISIDNPVVTDLIPTGQEYVPGSATISGGTESHVEGFSFDPTDPDASHTGTLTYTFGTKPVDTFIPGTVTINETYTIKFKTSVTEPDVYAANVSNRTYRNTASMTSDNIPAASDEGTQRVDSEVIDKSNQGYNYVTREISWRIQVNENEMDLDNVVITDMIPAGQEYVAGSFAINGGPQSYIEGFSFDATDIPADPPNHDGYSGTLTYTFGEMSPGFTPGGTITDEYIITFKTKVTDLTVFNTNGTKSFSNSATITTNLVPTGVTNTDSQPVNNTVIGKTGAYSTGNTYIDWTIWVNTNDIGLSDAVITDQLQQGLALDTTSVKLYHATTDPSSGDLVQGSEITLTGDNVAYSVDTRLFEFTIPTPLAGGYILTFRTDVTDKGQSPFINEASFNGTGTLQQGTENPIAVSWSGSGSSGTGDVGSMDVIKVDKNDHSTKLSGAEFELEDMYGNIVQRVTTDGTGSALFERLRFDVDYTVREITAPTGYVLSSEEYTFQIDSAAASKNLTYNYENDPVVGSITFTKLDWNSNPLAGAEFTLYDSGSNPVGTATSGADGVVLFENLAYGDYTIRETTPPEGYLLSSEVLTASVTQDGVTVIANPASITNDIITGSIQLVKMDEDDITPLAGASLSLFSAADTEFSTPLDTKVSGADGTVLFENVIYGDYVIKETAAPTGYTVSDRTIDVSVRLHGETVDAGTYINEKIRADIEIFKSNKIGQALSGAKFGLYDTGDHLIAEAVSGDDGIARFTDVLFGTYTIREIEAPERYLLSEEIVDINIQTTELVRYTFVNQIKNEYAYLIDSPDTGDTIFWSVAIFIALITLFGILFFVHDYTVKNKRKRSA